MPSLVRHRLMFTRAVYGAFCQHSWYVYGAIEALHAAEIAHEDSGVPVMVFEAPEGRIVRELYTVGGKAKAKRWTA